MLSILLSEAEKFNITPEVQIELLKTVVQIAPSIGIGIFFLNSIDKQLAATKDLIAANKDNLEKQLASNKESTTLLIEAMEFRMNTVLKDFVQKASKDEKS